MTQDIVIVVENGRKLTEAEATSQLQAQGLQFSPDAGAIITAVFDANGAVLARAMEAAGHIGATVKHNIFMVPVSYALYLKDAKDENGDIGLKNHLEAAAKTGVSLAAYFGAETSTAAGLIAVGAPGAFAIGAGIVVGCGVVTAMDMVEYDGKNLYDYVRDWLKNAIKSNKDKLSETPQLSSLDYDKAFISEPVESLDDMPIIEIHSIEEYYIYLASLKKPADSIEEPLVEF